MTKKNCKTFMLSFIVLITIVCFTTEVHAVKLGGRLINGPRNITYTVNGGAAPYTPNINTAANNWMYTGYDNPIYMTAVSSTTGSTVDIYSYSDSATSTIAYTIFFNKNNQQQYPSSNYWWTKIFLNNKYINDTSINHNAVMAHEFGHVLGLDENNKNVNSIMCQTGAGRKVNKPQKVDSEEVVSIYGRY